MLRWHPEQRSDLLDGLDGGAHWDVYILGSRSISNPHFKLNSLGYIHERSPGMGCNKMTSYRTKATPSKPATPARLIATAPVAAGAALGDEVGEVAAELEDPELEPVFEAGVSVV